LRGPPASNCTAVCLAVKPAGEPDAVEPHVRFDERGWETERCRMAQATAPILDSAIPAVATAAKDGRSRLESGRWRSATRWLPERELREKAPGVWLGSQILGVRAARPAHREHRAPARFAPHGHIAAHHARELAREGKAQPSTAVAARGQGICLGEFLEQF